MSDETINPAAAAAPGETPIASAPAVEAPAPAAPEPVAPVDPATIPSLMSSEPSEPEKPNVAEPAVSATEEKPATPTEPVKPADEPAKEPAQAAEEQKQPEAAEPAVPVEWKLELPETLQADEAKVGEFKSILGDLLAPKEGETRDQAASRLLKMHGDAMQQYDAQQTARLWENWNNYRAENRKKILADPELGGSGHETVKAACKRMQDLFTSGMDKAQKAEFEQFLIETGGGDHPAYMRLLHRAAKHFDEPPLPPPNPKPPKDNGRNPNERRSAVLYDRTKTAR